MGTDGGNRGGQRESEDDDGFPSAAKPLSDKLKALRLSNGQPKRRGKPRMDTNEE